MNTIDQNEEPSGHKNGMKDASKFNYFSAISGLLLILLIITLVVQFPESNNTQYEFFRTVLAIASGAFAATISGFLNIEYKGIIQAGGGLGVLVMVYFFPPAGTEPQNIDLTIFIESTSGETILRNKGQLQLKFGNEKRAVDIGDEGSAVFKNISTSKIADIMQLELLLDGWLFSNEQKTMPIKVSESGLTVHVIRDPAWCCVKGIVFDENSKNLEGVRLTIGNTTIISSDGGTFQFPPESQSDNHILSAQKEGYHDWSGKVVAGPEDQEIMMKKKLP